MTAGPSLDDAVSLRLPDEAATAALGRRLARLVRAGDVIALHGDLGSGKTALARALINALPGPDGGAAGEEEVPSPTFTLVQTYRRRPATVWHFDLYRVGDPGEIDELGWEEALADGVVLVEWPDRLGVRLPRARLDVRLAFAAAGPGRTAELRGGGGWCERLRELDGLG